MSSLSKISLILLCWACFVNGAYAQILDDDVGSTQNNIILDDSEDEEEIFNELFGEHEEIERDITKVKNFNDVLDASVDLLKQQGADEPMEETTEPVIPLEGDLQIGITNGSFSIYKDPIGRSACKFSVTLNSTLNKPIKVIALNLIYPMRRFSFVFRDVPAGKAQERFIRTSGDICYNIKGVPDISVNKCRIFTASGMECAERIRWTDNITAPDSKQRRYFFHQ